MSVTAGSGSLPAGWEEPYTPEGRPYYVDHNTCTTTWLTPLFVSWVLMGQNTALQPQTISQLGPLLSGWEMQLTSTARVYFVDHNTKTTTWDAPCLPLTLDANIPQYKEKTHLFQKSACHASTAWELPDQSRKQSHLRGQLRRNYASND